VGATGDTTLTAAVTRTQTMAGTMVEKAPKTEAGRRTIVVPPNVLPELEHHMTTYVDPEADAPVLKGGYRSLRTAWDNARRRVGVNLSLHDLRHSGLTWSAATGATVVELMHRAGHKSALAALRCQHATEDRDRALADALGALAAVVPLGPRDGRAMEVPGAETPGSSPGAESA
jgi:integrase